MAEKTESTVKTAGKHTKQNGYSSKTLRTKLEKKQVQADERNHRHDLLSITEKIKKVKSRRGESKRELARLEKRLTESKKPAPAAEAVKPVVVTEKKKVQKKS
jgi:hypothetical protein